MKRNFAKRDIKEFNKFRAGFQHFVCCTLLFCYLKLRYKVKYIGTEKIKKNDKYIVAGNHISNWDPFLVSWAVRKNAVAFMAKQELFKKFFSMLLMDWSGTFAVNREKVEVATLRTALSIKNTNWNLGIFPQGTRQPYGDFSNISKGFATLAQKTKTKILPVLICGSDKKAGWNLPFFKKNLIVIKVGEFIPYSDNIDEVTNNWVNSIKQMMEAENVAT